MEPSCNTETQDGTAAPTKKTARRVSFADNEITSIHLFPTDDPNDSEETPTRNAAAVVESNDDVISSPFLRPTASPLSPSGTGTGTGTDASTDDEEAFHAPVSASFIVPGQFSGSDSGFSDDCHDLTMDSNTFSMHYRSLAMSDSIDLRTPSQNSTPAATATATATAGSSMTLSEAKNRFSNALVHAADSAISARESKDMSVVEVDENHFRYDYLRICPSLDAILSEASKDVSSVSELSNRSGYILAKVAKGNDIDIDTVADADADASVLRVQPLVNNVFERKHDESPAREVMVASNYVHEASTPLLPSLQARLSEMRHGNMQDLSCQGNSDASNFAAEISSGKKRKSYEILRDGVEEIGRIYSSSQFHKGGKSDQWLVLERTGDMRSEIEKLGVQTGKTWTDIVKTFSWGTIQLLSPSVDKLNLRLIGVLEDILVHLRKVNICKASCSEIHSQKISDPLCIPRHKRFVVARNLLFNIAYGKAKLQLMHIKRERLQKKLQVLQEFQMMKLNGITCSTKHEAMDSQANDSYFHSILLNYEGKCQVSSENVTTMRQELETLDWKAKSLKKSFPSHCKIKPHQTFADTIRFVHDYLKKRISCKCIFQNLQLWDIDNFEHVDGCYRVSLNYYGYVIQRFTVIACPSLSIIVSNKLADTKIVKTFPDVDAFSAFMFVFNSHTTQNYTDTKGLAQETQVTSSLLSNLLDLVEEVKLARIETKNLIQAKFYSQSVGQLDLLLSFLDFCSGREVKVTLDMTCLRCGVYPVEILPYRIYDPASGEHKASSLVAEIRTALKGVRVGYSRIMRLCRCISQAVQACTLSR